MFLDQEMTPELVQAMQEQMIVIAHSKAEAEEKTMDVRTSPHTTANLAASSLQDILDIWKGSNTPWSVLNGTRVLDLASGSGYSRDLSGGMWYPQFARLCAINGADVVAIDFYPQRGLDQKLFTWADADLVNVVLGKGLRSVPVLAGREFDLIYSENFVGVNPYQDLVDRLVHKGIMMRDFEKALLNQAGELLAEGGLLSLDTTNTNGSLARYTRQK